MNLNYKVLLAPVLGAASAYLAGKGLNLTPDQLYAAITLLASASTWVAHYFDKKPQAGDVKK